MAWEFNDEDYGYLYCPGRSMAGIFYEEDDGTQGTLQWPDFNVCPPLVPPVDPPAIIISSSRGLAVFRCAYGPFSLYYVSNPFTPQRHHAFHLLIPPPRPHDPEDTEVVLITNTARHSFHVVCVHHFLFDWYLFDIFSSDTGQWESIPRRMAYDVLPNTGVSCDGSAFWLTNRTTTDKVLRLKLSDNSLNDWMFHHLDLPYDPSEEQGGGMQLGRAGDRLGLAIVSPASRRVDMYTLGEEDAFESSGFLGVDIRPGQHFNANAGATFYSSDAGLTIRCNAMPEVIRFESSKTEVPLLVDNRLVVWEQNSCIYDRARLRVLTEDAPYNIARGVPHVRTSLLPMNFIENGNGHR